MRDIVEDTKREVRIILERAKPQDPVYPGDLEAADRLREKISALGSNITGVSTLEEIFDHLYGCLISLTELQRSYPRGRVVVKKINTFINDKAPSRVNDQIFDFMTAVTGIIPRVNSSLSSSLRAAAEDKMRDLMLEKIRLNEEKMAAFERSNQLEKKLLDAQAEELEAKRKLVEADQRNLENQKALVSANSQLEVFNNLRRDITSFVQGVDSKGGVSAGELRAFLHESGISVPRVVPSQASSTPVPDKGSSTTSTGQATTPKAPVDGPFGGVYAKTQLKLEQYLSEAKRRLISEVKRQALSELFVFFVMEMHNVPIGSLPSKLEDGSEADFYKFESSEISRFSLIVSNLSGTPGFNDEPPLVVAKYQDDARVRAVFASIVGKENGGFTAINKEFAKRLLKPLNSSGHDSNVLQTPRP